MWLKLLQCDFLLAPLVVEVVVVVEKNKTTIKHKGRKDIHTHKSQKKENNKRFKGPKNMKN